MISKEVLELIKSSKKILITSHIFPDEDAVASCLGVYAYLKQTVESEVKIFLTHEQPSDRWGYLSDFSKVEWGTDIREVVSEYDLVFFLDGNTAGRFVLDRGEIELNGIKTICIDHHPGDSDDYTFNLSNQSAASASQIVYDLFFSDQKYLSPETAETLLMGIMGDTGTFKYISHKNIEAMEIAKELISFGKLDVQRLDLRLSQMTETTIELLAKLLANTNKVKLEGAADFTFTYLDKSELENYSLKQVKEAIGKYKFAFLRQLIGYPWGFVVSPESGDQYSVSFRSTPGAPIVRGFAMELGGGGHNMAASGTYLLEGKDVSPLQIGKEVVDIIKSSKIEIAS